MPISNNKYQLPYNFVEEASSSISPKLRKISGKRVQAQFQDICNNLDPNQNYQISQAVQNLQDKALSTQGGALQNDIDMAGHKINNYNKQDSTFLANLKNYYPNSILYSKDTITGETRHIIDSNNTALTLPNPKKNELTTYILQNEDLSLIPQNNPNAWTLKATINITELPVSIRLVVQDLAFLTNSGFSTENGLVGGNIIRPATYFVINNHPEGKEYHYGIMQRGAGGVYFPDDGWEDEAVYGHVNKYSDLNPNYTFFSYRDIATKYGIYVSVFIGTGTIGQDEALFLQKDLYFGAKHSLPIKQDDIVTSYVSGTDNIKINKIN